MQSIEEDGAQIGSQLEQWGARLDELMAKAATIGENAKNKGREHLDTLEAKHAKARSKLAELKAASSDKWVILKGDLETAVRDVETAFKNLNR